MPETALTQMMPGASQASTRLKTGLALGLILVLVLSLWIGWVPIAPDELGGIVRVWLGIDAGEAIAGKALVFGMVRIPRALITVLVGMGLSAAGVVYQGFFRNPLVSPDILGGIRRRHVRRGIGASHGR